MLNVKMYKTNKLKKLFFIIERQQLLRRRQQQLCDNDNSNSCCFVSSARPEVIQIGQEIAANCRAAYFAQAMGVACLSARKVNAPMQCIVSTASYLVRST